jgi:hypothetical protein
MGNPLLKPKTTDPSLKSSTSWRNPPDQRLHMQSTSVHDPQATPNSRIPMQSSISVVTSLLPRIRVYCFFPDASKSFAVHVDCDFAGNWVKEDAMNDPSTANSRTGYIISYGGRPIIWVSKLQTEVVMSSRESEFVGLSESLRIAIVMMNLLTAIKSFGIPISNTSPKIYTANYSKTMREPFSSPKSPRMRPRTRRISQKYHHHQGRLYSKVSISFHIGLEYNFKFLHFSLDLTFFLSSSSTSYTKHLSCVITSRVRV